MVSFSEALVAAKEGKKIARSGWNGKGMYVFKMDGYPDGVVANEETKRKTKCDAVIIRPYLNMMDSQGQLVPWLASQTDILSEDWTILE